MKKVLFTIATLISAGAFAACPTGTAVAPNTVGQNATTCVVSGTYVDDLTLTADNDYLLVGGVFIGSDDGQGNIDSANLTIEPGTHIYAMKAQAGQAADPSQQRKDFLVISRESKIFAEGTAQNPIVFTSGNANPQRGDWGGLFIDGKAPTNKCTDLNNCSAEGEAGTGFYGGNDVDDDSGILQYVIVKYSGDKITNEKEFNGITFNGVGAGTIVEYIQILETGDDGIEFFGGTVNVKRAVIKGAGDDSIDWTDGYRGLMQFVLVVQTDDEADRGIEADNNKKNTSASPRSNPVLSNITLIGSVAGAEGTYFRVGSNVHFTNSLVTGFTKDCVRLKDAGPSVVIENNVFSCANLGAADMTVNKSMSSRDLGLAGFLPTANSPLLSGGQITGDMDLFFEDVSFIGAFDSQDNWTQGWTQDLN